MKFFSIPLYYLYPHHPHLNPPKNRFEIFTTPRIRILPFGSEWKNKGSTQAMKEVQKVGRGCNGCITAGSSRNRVQVSHAQTLHDNVIPFNPAEPRKPWDVSGVGAAWIRELYTFPFPLFFSLPSIFIFFLLSLFSVLSYFTLFQPLIELLEFDIDSWRPVPLFIFSNRIWTIGLESEERI